MLAGVIAATAGSVDGRNFRAVAVALALQVWVDASGMKLLKLARLRSGDIPVGLPPRCSNAASTRPHRAWARSSAGALGSIYFRLFIIARTGHVSVEDTAVHKKGAASSSE